MTKEKRKIVHSHAVDNYLTITTLDITMNGRGINGQFDYHEMPANDCKRYHHFIQYHLASGHEVYLVLEFNKGVTSHNLYIGESFKFTLHKQSVDNDSSEFTRPEFERKIEQKKEAMKNELVNGEYLYGFVDGLDWALRLLWAIEDEE